VEMTKDGCRAGKNEPWLRKRGTPDLLGGDWKAQERVGGVRSRAKPGDQDKQIKNECNGNSKKRRYEQKKMPETRAPKKKKKKEE